LKAIGPSKIHIVEYAEIQRADAETMDALTIVNQAVFELVPPVPGFGDASAVRRKKPRAKRKTDVQVAEIAALMEEMGALEVLDEGESPT
jgi:hypothetical protein